MFDRKQRMRIWLLMSCLIYVVGAWGCDERKPESINPEGKVTVVRPLGTWVMYGSGTRLFDPETLVKEMSILALGDSTYSLTYVEPQIFSFVESGKVAYDAETQRARFTVMASSGVDWRGHEPRKLVDVPELVPWQRDPGTEYEMEWVQDGDLLSLSSPDHESAYFKRMEPGSEGTVDISRSTKAQ